jgi:hypothetical protein
MTFILIKFTAGTGKVNGRKPYPGEGNPEYSRNYDDGIFKVVDDFLKKIIF